MQTDGQRATGEVGLPASPDAERAILGAVMLDNSRWYEAEEHLTGDEFSLLSHRDIWVAMRGLFDEAGAINIITVSDRLRGQKKLENIGGSAYLASLTDGVALRTSIKHHIHIVRDKFMARQIIDVSNASMMRAYEQADPIDDQFADLQQRLIEMIYRGRAVGVSLQQCGRSVMSELDAMRRLPPGDCIGVTTGLQDLDTLTTGFRKGELTIFGARPGGGKTAFMCQAVRAQIKAGHKPGIFSVEVPSDQILIRMACQEARLNVFDARDPRTMSQTDYNILQEVVAEIATSWPFFIEDGRMTPKRMAAIARAWVAKGCDCLWADYLGKLASRAPGKNEYERVTATADAMWDLARFTNVPLVCLSQLKRIDGEPTMEDLRSSGEIEQNANLVLLGDRPVTVDDLGNRHYTREDKIIIGKQRSGPANVFVPVAFNGPVGQFEPR